MEKTVILVISCDRYADVWKPFFSLFRKNWPDCPYRIFLATNHLDPKEPGVTTIKTGDDATWAIQLLHALDKIDSPYIIMLLEDYFIRSVVSTERVKQLVETGLRLNVHCLRLMPRPSPTLQLEGHPGLGILQKGDLYRVSTQAGLWRVETLRALLRPEQSGWDFESQGMELSSIYSDGFLGVYEPAIDYIQGVVGGRWYPRGLTVCRKAGIEVDLSHRKTMPRLNLIKIFLVYTVISRLKDKIRYFKRRLRATRQKSH